MRKLKRIDDAELRDLVFDYCGADEVLRKKVDIKYDMSVIVAPKYHIEKHGEAAATKKWVPLIRNVISKYKVLQDYQTDLCQ